MNAVRDELQLNPLGSESWIGHVEGTTDSSVILVQKDGVVFGSVSVDGKTYKIRYGGPGVHVVSEVDASLYAPENDPIPVSSFASSSGDVLQFAATDSGALFDLMVVYTRAARNAAGGTMPSRPSSSSARLRRTWLTRTAASSRVSGSSIWRKCNIPSPATWERT